MHNLITTKDKKFLAVAFRASALKQKADAINKELKEATKELKNFNADKLTVKQLQNDFTIVNGYTSEVVCTQTTQNRTKLNEAEVCADLGVKALNVENGYKFINPVHCLKIGKLTKKGF